MSHMNSKAGFTPVNSIQELSLDEIDTVNGANGFSDAADGFAAAAVVAGGAAAIPTPATPSLLAFAAIAGILSIGSNYLSRHVTSGDGQPGGYRCGRSGREPDVCVAPN